MANIQLMKSNITREFTGEVNASRTTFVSMTAACNRMLDKLNPLRDLGAPIQDEIDFVLACRDVVVDAHTQARRRFLGELPEQVQPTLVKEVTAESVVVDLQKMLNTLTYVDLSDLFDDVIKALYNSDDYRLVEACFENYGRIFDEYAKDRLLEEVSDEIREDIAEKLRKFANDIEQG